jgi:hypothetical protein
MTKIFLINIKYFLIKIITVKLRKKNISELKL